MILRWILVVLLLSWAPLAFAAGCPSWELQSGSNCIIGQPTVATNAALKAITSNQPAYIYRTGYYASGDGGDAIYAWNSSSSCTDDGGSCIAPNSGTGRWILNNNGAVSIRVFGAHCDGNPASPNGSTPTDDTAVFSAALTARTSIFVPANTVCGITLNSASDGLKLDNGQRLFGQNEFSSILLFTLNFTPTYNWAVNAVGAKTITNISVASNVGTVQTAWSHGLPAGSTVTIVDSVDAGLGGTFTTPAATSFTGSISGTTLTTTGGAPAIGQAVFYAPSSGATIPVAASTYIISGSGTSWTVNKSQTVASESMIATGIAAPDKINIVMPSATNGTYCPSGNTSGPTCTTKNITGLTTNSGTGVTLIRALNRDGGSGRTYNNAVEVDHLQLRTNNNPAKPLIYIDATGWQGGRVHNISLWGFPGTVADGQIGIVCSDQSVTGSTNLVCFFNHFEDISFNAVQTPVHWSTSTEGQNNTGVNSFNSFYGNARVMFDTTGTSGEAASGVLTNWYLVGDNDPNSYDVYPIKMQQTTMMNFSCEGCANLNAFNGSLLTTAPQTTANMWIDAPSITSQGGKVFHAGAVDSGNTLLLQPYDHTIMCGSGGGTLNLPASPLVYTGPGTAGVGGQIVMIRARGGTCTIQGNGHTVEGGSSLSLTSPNTVTLQWMVPPVSDWVAIGH